MKTEMERFAANLREREKKHRARAESFVANLGKRRWDAERAELLGDVAEAAEKAAARPQRKRNKAMLTALAAALIFPLGGCEEWKSKWKQGALEEDGALSADVELSLIKVEDCEYLVFENSKRGFNNYSLSITHKGNCENPIHQRPPEPE